MSSDEYDNILFNQTDGIKIFEQNKGSNKLSDFEGPIDKYFIFTVHRDTLQEGQLNGGFGTGHNRSSRHDTFYVFKKFLISKVPSSYCGQHDRYNIGIHKHNLPNNILFSLKTINFNDINNNGLNINKLITFYDKNTNYFKSNSDIHYEKLELKYKQEKEMIEQGKNKLLLEKEDKSILIKEKQTELDKLILENQQKIDYYKSLEQQIIDVNKEKDIIKEEKRKIAIVKEKMAQQKRDFDEEKFKFELEKDRINDIDVDKFINSVLD
jgi:hypothetical protein